MRSLCLAVLAACLAAPVAASADDIVPAGTLRAFYISINPVQAFVDAKTGETRGPAATLARELARRLGVGVSIKSAPVATGVIDAVKNGEADIGFIAYDPLRAAEVDFSQNYALAQNTFVVPTSSPIRSVSDIDQPGNRVGVAERDVGDLFLTRSLKHAEIRRNPGGNIVVGLKWMAEGEIAAYAANRHRLAEISSRTIGLRLLPDNFFGAEQAIAVKKGNARLLEAVNKLIEEARGSGMIADAIKSAGLIGVDVAPPKTPR